MTYPYPPQLDNELRPVTVPPATRRRADALIALIEHPATSDAERAAAATRFSALIGALPAAEAAEAPYSVDVHPAWPYISVECHGGGYAEPCADPTDHRAVADAVRAAGAVPCYWQGEIRVRQEVAA